MMIIENEKVKRNWNIVLSCVFSVFALRVLLLVPVCKEGYLGVYVSLLVACLTMVLSHGFLAVYFHKYLLQISEEEITVKTLFKAKTYPFAELESFKTKKDGFSAGFFILQWKNGEELRLYTRRAGELWARLDRQMWTNATQAEGNTASPPPPWAVSARKTSAMQIVAGVLFVLTLLALPLSIQIAESLSDGEVFGFAFVRYLWILWAVMPVVILSYTVGFVQSGEGYPAKKNKIASFIVLPLLFIFGAFPVLTNFSYAPEPVYAVAQEAEMPLPKEIKVATRDFGVASYAYVKILDEGEAKAFKEQAVNGYPWKSSLSEPIRAALPEFEQMVLTDYHRFAVYNVSDKKMNEVSYGKEKEYTVFAYDTETGGLLILYDMNLTVERVS